MKNYECRIRHEFKFGHFKEVSTGTIEAESPLAAATVMLTRFINDDQANVAGRLTDDDVDSYESVPGVTVFTLIDDDLSVEVAEQPHTLNELPWKGNDIDDEMGMRIMRGIKAQEGDWS